MKLPSFIKVSKPTSEQIKKDLIAVVVAFLAGFIASWQHQPNPASKAAVIASWSAGVAAVAVLIKSILTTL